MRRIQGALAALLTAGTILAIPAAGHAAPQPRQIFCQHTYTAWHFKQAAKRFYRGVSIPTAIQRSKLWAIEDCPRIPSDSELDARLWAQQIAYNQKRRNPPPPPVAQPASELASCIMYREATDNPEAVNGQYEGLGQWDATAWAEDGGLRYASTPLGASYSEQVAVLNNEGTAGMEQQQAQWDGCS